jgi:hypothetical protein
MQSKTILDRLKEGINIRILIPLTILYIILNLFKVFFDFSFIFYLQIILLPVILFSIFSFAALVLYIVFALINKSTPQLNKLKSYVLSAVIGLSVVHFVKKWDDSQRDISRLMIVESLERYNTDNQKYPDSLDALNLDKLPYFYSTNRYHYVCATTKDEFRLFLVRHGQAYYEWNEEIQNFKINRAWSRDAAQQ